MMMKLHRARKLTGEKGSLALEQILFIAAVVVMSASIYAFYNEIGGYFSGFKVQTPPTNFGANPGSGG